MVSCRTRVCSSRGTIRSSWCSCASRTPARGRGGSRSMPTSGSCWGGAAMTPRVSSRPSPIARRVREFWSGLLGGIQVRTPEPAIDVMVNGWLAYQTLACRLWARTALYQSGGAFGYRDQLQDAAALTPLDPQLTRRQILLHAGHQ